MARLTGASAEQVASYFVSYLFKNYPTNKHVRRVAAWIGFIVCGIGRIVGATWHIPKVRQLQFDYAGHQFKAKFNHKIGKGKALDRGGIEIVEVFPGRGSPEGEVVISIATLREAEDFYNRGRHVLDDWLAER